MTYSGSRKKRISEARSLFCYWCVRELGESITDVAKLLGLTQPAIGYAVERGELLAKNEKNDLIGCFLRFLWTSRTSEMRMECDEGQRQDAKA